MNLTQLLGALTLVTGGGLLLSPPFVHQGRFVEWTGSMVVALGPLCVTAIVLGVLTIWISQGGKYDLGQEQEQRAPRKENPGEQSGE